MLSVVRRKVRGLPGAAAIVLAAAFAAFPLFWLVTSALKQPSEIVKLPPVWLPGQPSLTAFADAFRLLPVGSAFLNSFLIAGLSTLSVVATSTAAGWAFAIYRFRGRDQLFLVLLATMFVPPIATLVPLYWLVANAGLLNSIVGVLVPQLANAFGIYLIRQFARGVPRELVDAARVDGASEWQILRRIAVPLMRPGDRDVGPVRLRLLLERVSLAARDSAEPGPVHDRAADQSALVLHHVRPARERHLCRHAPGHPAQHRPVPARASHVFRCGFASAVKG